MMYQTDNKELKKIMVDKEIGTITELSRLSGVSRTTVAQVVNGEINPSTDVMYRLAGALEMSSLQAGEVFFAPNLRDA